MAISIFVRLLVMALAASLSLTSASESPAPSQPPSLPVSPPRQSPSPPAAIQEKQLRNIVDALIGASDFGGWATLLSSANPSALPLTATIFVPRDEAISGDLDPLLIPYHIVPQRLTFSELEELPTQTRLPTLLSSKFIVVTNNSPSNFTIDDSRITQADIFLNAAFALHGTDKILDYSAFGDGVGPIAPPPPPPPPRYSNLKKKPAPLAAVASSACHSCTRTALILSTFSWFCFCSRFFGI